MNLLARYSNAPTRRHWNGVIDIFCYLKGTTDLGLFYTLRVVSPLIALGSILALLVTQMLDIRLTHIEHVLKWVMSFPLGTPLYL